MKWNRLLLLLGLLVPSLALAQGSQHNNFAWGLNGATIVSLPGATITVCAGTNVPGSGSTCTPTTTIYTTASLGTQKANPFTADAGGNYNFWATPGSSYVISVAASGYTTYSYSWTAGGGAGGGNVVSSGSPTSGQLAVWTNSSSIQGLTALPAANFPALTGDVTNTAGSLATTVGGIRGASVASLAVGYLYYNGSSIIWNTGSSSGVSSLNSLTGSVTLVAGGNITITPGGQNLTIAASGSGMVWPAAAGIANYAGSSTWGTSITTSTGLRGVITDETGTGALVFAANPTLVGATLTGELFTVASGSANAGFNLPHGAAPTSPVNGDLWTTTGGLYARINGATVGPIGTGTGTYYQTLQGNGAAQVQRPIMNLIAGTNMTVNCADDSANTRTNCTLISSATSSTAWSAVTSGTNTNVLVMGSGGSFSYSGTGVINANQILGTNWPALTTGYLYYNGSALSWAVGGGMTWPAAAGIANYAGSSTWGTSITTSAGLAGVITDETGSGALVFATSPTLVTPNLGTPTALTLTNATGLPVGGIAGLASGMGTFLGTATSANLRAALTDDTGTGFAVFNGNPTMAGATFTAELVTVASAAGNAGFNLPPGSAPTAPANGDLWTTSAGLYVRINGGTVGPLAAAGGTTPSQFFWSNPNPLSSSLVLYGPMAFATAATIPTNGTDANGFTSFVLGTAPTATWTATIYRIPYAGAGTVACSGTPASIGTIQVSTSNIATFTITQTNFAKGDCYEVVAPSSVDTTAANPSMTVYLLK
jgi:hypothetical protein